MSTCTGPEGGASAGLIVPFGEEDHTWPPWKWAEEECARGSSAGGHVSSSAHASSRVAFPNTRFPLHSSARAHPHTHLRLPVALLSSVADGHIGERRVGDVSVVKVALCNRSRTDAIVKIDVDAARPSAFRVRHHQVPICLSISFNGKIVYKFIHMPCALPCAVRDVHRSSSDALRLKTKCTPLSLLAASLLSLTRLPNLPPPHTPSPSLAASLSCSISPPIHPALRSLCHGHLGAGTRRALCDAAGLLCACGARQNAAQTFFLLLSSGLFTSSRPQRQCNLKVSQRARTVTPCLHVDGR